LDKIDARPLAGKYALVTGGAGRIGREIALTLARAGSNVAITYFQSAVHAETATRISELGVRSLAISCDLRNVKTIPAAVESVAREFGSLDILVNNAGAYQTRTFDEITLEDWDEMFAVNVRGAFFMTQACATQLTSRRGKVVNIGSLGGIRPWATHPHYCASKAALHMLTQASAKALAPEISVNCVAPGMIQGESDSEAVLKSLREKTPMQRTGTAQQVADAVLFFATSDPFITGQILTVDGGLGLA
jgi:NAD(P)-dependent dehydrogenase (short-subunit alcohol dehydrogenase family)